MIYRSVTIIALVFLVIGCKESNFVINKDDTGQVTEKYKVNDQSQKHGIYEGYIDGVLTEKAVYQNGKLHGSRKLFHTNGQVEIEENYEEDLIVGSYKTYYSDGTIAQQASYESGMMQGSLKSFYKSGQLKEEVTMVDNEENGPFKEYYENGILKWAGQFLNGDNEYGLLQNYNEQGDLIKKMQCNELGVCTTIWTLEKGDIKPKN